MKVSVSLSEKDLTVLDEFVRAQGLASRSAGVQRAIRMLNGPELAAAYAEAFADGEGSADKASWDGVAADGLNDDAW